MIEFVRIHRANKGSLQYLETALDRIHGMSQRWDGAAEALVNEVWEYLAKTPHALGLWVALQDGQVIGHMLAFIRAWDARWVVWVSQVESDAPMDRQTHLKALEEIEDFGETFNASFANTARLQVSEVMMVTPHPPQFWEKLGFRRYRTMMDRPLRAKP